MICCYVNFSSNPLRASWLADCGFCIQKAPYQTPQFNHKKWYSVCTVTDIFTRIDSPAEALCCIGTAHRCTSRASTCVGVVAQSFGQQRDSQSINAGRPPPHGVDRYVLCGAWCTLGVFVRERVMCWCRCAYVRVARMATFSKAATRLTVWVCGGTRGCMDVE